MDVIERLAQRIGRSVAVDDEDLNYVGHSSHRFGDEDMIRLRTLVERRTPEPVREYVLAHGLRRWTEPYLLPAMHRHGFENDRLIYPLRADSQLVGLMWIMHDGDFTQADHAACSEAGDALEGLMRDRAARSTEADERRGREMEALISRDPAAREDALESLRAHGLFAPGRRAVAMVLDAGAPAAVHEALPALRRAWSRSTTALNSRSLTVSGDRGLALLDAAGTEVRAMVLDTADALVRHLQLLSPGTAADLRLGIGSAVAPEEAHLSYEQAQAALAFRGGNGEDDCGEAPAGHSILWDDHPLCGLLHCMMPAELDSARLPTVLRETVGGQPRESLVTVRAYLDTGGNAAATAERMHLHRTTVYYRLRQFEEATGIDLSSGRNRLMLHLWLELEVRFR